MAKPIDPNDPTWQISPEEKEKLPTATKSEIALISMSGLVITEDGKLKKSKYLNMLSSTLDDYTDMVFTKEEAIRVHNTIYALKSGAGAAMPIICTGPLCPWATRCVYQQMDKAPIGRQCLVELNLMKQWQINYLDEYEVEMDNFTDMTLVTELVEVELSLYRCNLSMSLDSEQATGIVDVNIGMDNNGNAITQKQISQLVELRERLMNRKHRILKLLVGDRQEKYKREAALKTREAKDPSSTMAQLKEQMESLHRELGKATAKLVEEFPLTGRVVGETEEVNGQKGFYGEATPLSPDDLPEE